MKQVAQLNSLKAQMSLEQSSKCSSCCWQEQLQLLFQLSQTSKILNPSQKAGLEFKRKLKTSILGSLEEKTQKA